jgi:hypothetical protein
VWDPSEQADITVSLEAVGADFANVQALLSTTDPFITIDVGSAAFGGISEGGTANNASDPFKATAGASCPSPRKVVFDLHVTADTGGAYAADFSFEGTVGRIPCEALADFNNPGAFPYGVAFDGMHLWVTCSGETQIFKLDRNGNTVGVIPAPESAENAVGIDYDRGNQCLWVTNATTKKIYKVNPSDGSVLSSFSSPATSYPTGLAFDGTNLWAVDRDDNTIYEVATDGSVLSSFVVPITSIYGPRGLAYEPNAESAQGEGTLILFITFWNAGATALDSCGIYEIKRDGTLIPEHSCITPGNTDSNGRLVCVDPDSGQYLVDGGERGPIYRITGFYRRKLEVEEPALRPVITNLAVLPTISRHEVAIGFYTPEPGKVEVNIYDVAGQLVSSLVNGRLAAGQHHMEWNGTDLSGRNAPAGIYFCQVHTAGFQASRKFILVR